MATSVSDPNHNWSSHRLAGCNRIPLTLGDFHLWSKPQLIQAIGLAGCNRTLLTIFSNPVVGSSEQKSIAQKSIEQMSKKQYVQSTLVQLVVVQCSVVSCSICNLFN